MSKAIDITNQKFGKLTVVERVQNNQAGRARWICTCDCGEQSIVTGKNLRSGKVLSCGCGKRYSNKSHGMKQSLEYSTWTGMKKRCYDKNQENYKDYGGRGITICDRWKNSFQNFYTDMGKRPSKNHSIDRIDVNGNYEPSNCRWATQSEQNRNQRNKLAKQI